MLGIPTLGTLLALVFCPYNEVLFPIIIKSIVFTFIYWQGVYFIIDFYRKKFPTIKKTAKRLFITLLVVSLYLIITDSLLRLVSDHFF